VIIVTIIDIIAVSNNCELVPPQHYIITKYTSSVLNGWNYIVNIS